jgi:hypothetical protein
LSDNKRDCLTHPARFGWKHKLGEKTSALIGDGTGYSIGWDSGFSRGHEVDRDQVAGRPTLTLNPHHCTDWSARGFQNKGRHRPRRGRFQGRSWSFQEEGQASNKQRKGDQPNQYYHNYQQLHAGWTTPEIFNVHLYLLDICVE